LSSAARSLKCDIEVLLPNLATLVVEAVIDRGCGLVLDVRLRAAEAAARGVAGVQLSTSPIWDYPGPEDVWQ